MNAVGYKPVFAIFDASLQGDILIFVFGCIDGIRVEGLRMEKAAGKNPP